MSFPQSFYQFNTKPNERFGTNNITDVTINSWIIQMLQENKFNTKCTFIATGNTIVIFMRYSNGRKECFVAKNYWSCDY